MEHRRVGRCLLCSQCYNRRRVHGQPRLGCEVRRPYHHPRSRRQRKCRDCERRFGSNLFPCLFLRNRWQDLRRNRNILAGNSGRLNLKRIFRCGNSCHRSYRHLRRRPLYQQDQRCRCQGQRSECRLRDGAYAGSPRCHGGIHRHMVRMVSARLAGHRDPQCRNARQVHRPRLSRRRHYADNVAVPRAGRRLSPRLSRPRFRRRPLFWNKQFDSYGSPRRCRQEGCRNGRRQHRGLC